MNDDSKKLLQKKIGVHRARQDASLASQGFRYTCMPPQSIDDRP